MSAGASLKARRTDIQVLRAWAVTLVLLHHASLPFARAGYLGVDIFFVISGFLMTRIIAGDLREGTFSFGAFYFRRAKRLLPASLTVVAICMPASLVLMPASLQGDFLKTVVGAATFTTNHILASQAGYFDVSSETAPLLHYWSLAVEEQYYFVIPVALFLCPPRYWAWGALVATIASLALCFFVARTSPTTAFYLLPTRAWEMGVGSLAAIMFTGARSRRLAHALFWPAVGVLVIVPVAGVGPDLGLGHPGVEALVVCLATMAILIAARSTAGTGRAMTAALGVASRIGDASYSLYLAHWPFFAFTAMAWPGELPLSVRVLLLACAIIAGLMLYRLVERPIHRARFERPARLAVPLFAASALAISGALALPLMRPVDPVQAELRREAVGLSPACIVGDVTSERWRQECRSTATPRVLVWGDSHAMHFASAVAAEVDGGVLQATLPACPPTMGLAWFDSGMSEGQARDCIAFNQRVVQMIEKEPSIEVVVLAGALHAYFLGGVGMYREGDGQIEAEASPVSAALGRTASDIRALGKRVVFLRSPPSADFDIGLCHERRDLGLPLIGPNAACAIPRDMARMRSAEATRVLDGLAAEAALPSIGFEDVLCDAGACRTMLDGQRLYRDNSHLSVRGARALARHVNLADRIRATAN